jgi:transposase
MQVSKVWWSMLRMSFSRFVAHYGFLSEFCNPESGNEKGHVGAMVNYIRNNFLLPEVPYEKLADLDH